MCGLAGILYRDPGRPVDPNVLEAMGERIAHRGPDALGIWSKPGVGLVHRRLSIIDLAGGRQPIENEDGSIQLIFNGEIYNYRELRADLQGRGHRFASQSDTEVLVHLYEEMAERLTERLRGMFAFAVWDRKRGRLLLGRDRLGIKPLYVYHDGEVAVFGSELKAILACPDVPRTVDVESLENYLAFGMVPGPGTIFKNIEKLPPAHTLVFQQDPWQRAGRRYWRLRFEPDPRPDVREWQEALRAKMQEVVKLHLIADVPVGAFLSGGLDSSVVVAEAVAGGAAELQTFSIGFREESFSELPFARQVSRRFGTRHVEEIVTADAVSLLDDLSHHYDEPFADSSAIPTFLLSRLARRSVKVVLSGDGGDEAFGGYARYAHDLREAAVRRCLPAWFQRAVLGPLARAYPKADWLPRTLRAKTALTNLSLDAASAYANTLTICRRPMRRKLLSPDLLPMLNGHEPERVIREGVARAPGTDALGGMIAADVDTILPDDFLVKVDRASMAHGLEVRPPFLDHELLELAGRIPSRLKVRGGQTKWILKKAYGAELPRTAVCRPKHGFEMPIDAWLRGPLRQRFEDAVLDSRGQMSSLVELGVVRGLYRSHLNGTGRHGAVLWALLVLDSWARRYLSAGATGLPATHDLTAFASNPLRAVTKAMG